MKTFWLLETNPFKSNKSTHYRIWANIRAAQGYKEEALTRQEIMLLLKKMLEKGIIQSKSPQLAIYNNFMSYMKKLGTVVERRPDVSNKN